MWPFDSGSNRRERNRGRDESSGSDSDRSEDDAETTTVTKTKEATYTEHTATGRFIDGTEREYTFDAMDKGQNGITLKNYTGAGVKERRMFSYVDFYKEAFVTIPYHNLKDFETTNRQDRTMEYEVEEEVPVEEASDADA